MQTTGIITLLCILAILAVPAYAAPVVTDSGISKSASASWDSIIGPKSTWTSAETSEWVMGWIKIAPASELDNGVERYKYKYDIAAPGSPQSGLLYGPFPFSSGDAKMSRGVDSLFASYGPGAWEVRFYVTDTQTGTDNLVTSLPFWLTGGASGATVTMTTAPFTYYPTASTTSNMPTYAYTALTTTPSALTTTPALQGILAITSTPSGAMTYLDEVQQGSTPITLYNIAAGKHTVRVHDKGYMDNLTEVLVENQMTAQLVVALKKPGAENTPAQTALPTTEVPTATVNKAARDIYGDWACGDDCGVLYVRCRNCPEKTNLLVSGETILGYGRHYSDLTLMEWDWKVKSGFHTVTIDPPLYNTKTYEVTFPPGKKAEHTIFVNFADFTLADKGTIRVNCPDCGLMKISIEQYIYNKETTGFTFPYTKGLYDVCVEPDDQTRRCYVVSVYPNHMSVLDMKKSDFARKTIPLLAVLPILGVILAFWMKRVK